MASAQSDRAQHRWLMAAKSRHQTEGIQSAKLPSCGISGALTFSPIWSMSAGAELLRNLEVFRECE